MNDYGGGGRENQGEGRGRNFLCNCSDVSATMKRSEELLMPVVPIIIAFLVILVGWNHELKVIAARELHDGWIQFRSKENSHPDTPGVVIRNAEDLVAACRVEGKIKDPGQLSAILAEEFKVAKIDWQTQMIVAIDVGRIEDARMSIGPLKDHGWNLVFHYVVNRYRGGAEPKTTYLGKIMLVERIDREIRFRRTNTRSGSAFAK
jgi:hypothetical protein